MKKLLFRLLGIVLCIGIVWMYIVFCVMSSKPLQDRQSESFRVEETPVLSDTPLTVSDDLMALSIAFEGRLITKDDLSQGSVQTITFDGTKARKAVLNFPDCEIKAVMPASAAPTLTEGRETLSVSLTENDWTACGMPVLYANEGNRHCAYFSDASASFAVYAEDMDTAQFKQLLGSLKSY